MCKTAVPMRICPRFAHVMVCVYACVRVCVCMRVRVCVKERMGEFVCVFMCECVRGCGAAMCEDVPSFRSRGYVVASVSRID